MAMMLTSVLTLMAQVTTSSLSGKVTMTDTKEEAIGATIQAIHEPSGTKYASVTNANGRFTIQGMRNGGPYSVIISYIGYETKTFRDIVLELGETYNLNVWLSENANELTEVVVSAKASKFTAEKTGATTNINNRTIQDLPTISRGIGDIAKLSPYYGGSNSFAGSSGRSSNFTLDGANLNNNFGLSSDLPGGGMPVSMDAIDEVQIVVSPFDVRQSNFVGGVSMPSRSRVRTPSKERPTSTTPARTCTATEWTASRTPSPTPTSRRPSVSRWVAPSSRTSSSSLPTTSVPCQRTFQPTGIPMPRAEVLTARPIPRVRC